MKLRAEQIIKTYGDRQVVKGVSLEVNQGEIVGLLGPNGAGKTTSFYMMVGLVDPNEGNVYLDDSSITKLPMYKRAQMGIGYLAQEASVFRKMSVEDNIRSVLEMTTLSKKEQYSRCELLLNEFGLQGVRKNIGGLLSGGERRRTEIARALATDAEILLMDEAFSALDPLIRSEMQNILLDLQGELHKTIIFITHDLDEALKKMTSYENVWQVNAAEVAKYYQNN